MVGFFLSRVALSSKSLPSLGGGERSPTGRLFVFGGPAGKFLHQLLRGSVSIGVCIAQARGFAYSRSSPNLFRELANRALDRSLDRAPAVHHAGSDSALAAGNSGGPFSLALLEYSRPLGKPVVERSEFLSWIFCSSVFRLRDLAGARSPRPHHPPALLGRLGRTAGGSRDAHRRPIGGGAVPRPLFAAAGARRSRDSFSGMESVSRSAVPLGLPAPHDPHPHHPLQPGYFPVAVAGQPGCGHGAPAVRSSDLARRQRHQSAVHGS